MTWAGPFPSQPQLQSDKMGGQEGFRLFSDILGFHRGAGVRRERGADSQALSPPGSRLLGQGSIALVCFMNRVSS